MFKFKTFTSSNDFEKWQTKMSVIHELKIFQFVPIPLTIAGSTHCEDEKVEILKDQHDIQIGCFVVYETQGKSK